MQIINNQRKLKDNERGIREQTRFYFSTHSALMTIISLSLFTQISSVSANGWVLTQNVTYRPLDICLFQRTDDISFSYICNNNQLWIIISPGATCNDTQAIKVPFSGYSYDCDIENDYVQYSIWDLNLVSESAQCDDITNYQRPNSYAVITNKCLYEPATKLYKMDSCTDTIWTTFRYLDENCQRSIQYRPYSYMKHVECRLNDTFHEITKCTTKMNTIGDSFGYVQFTKQNVLFPLNECIQISDDYSVLFMCLHNTPYSASWSTNECGHISDATIKEVIVFAFSCSSNQHTFGTVHIYTNDDCGELNAHESYPTITNQCYNYFDENNTMKSGIFYCDHVSLWSVAYNLPNCDGKNGSYVMSNETESCSNNNTVRYIIDCHTNETTSTATPSISYSTSLTSSTATITTTTTKEATTVFTSTPRNNSNKKIIYVRSDADGSRCGRDDIIDICGTLKRASYAANQQYKGLLQDNITEIEIIVQGQNPERIRKLAALYKTNGYAANPCVPDEVNTFVTNYRSITYTFDRNYIHSMSDWYNVSLCEDYKTGTVDITTGLWADFFSQSSLAGYFTFTVNNLMIDSYVFAGRKNQPYHIAFVDTFVCNHCEFKDITIRSTHHDQPGDDITTQRSALIVGANVVLNNCIIDNITYIPSSSDVYDSYGYDHSFIIIDTIQQSLTYSGSYSVSIANDTQVTNINALSSFVYIMMERSSFDFYMLIDNVTFNEIFVMDALFYNEPDSVETVSSMDINNVYFFNINHGSILYSLDGSCTITITNITITTLQTIEDYLSIQRLIGRDDNLDYYSLFIFDSSSETIYMNHINLIYHYAHEMTTRCVDSLGGSTFMTMWMWEGLQAVTGVTLDFYHFFYHCQYPIQLLYNNAHLTIHQLSVYNDITDEIINEFREYIKTELAAIGYDVSSHDLYFEFSYQTYDTEDENYGDYAMIHSENELTIQSLYAYGYGVHKTIILSIDGSLTVDYMVSIPHTYCTISESCEFDGDTLHIGHLIRFNSVGSKCLDKELHVSNSFLFGAKQQSIIIGGGYAYVHNVTIEMSLIGISTGTYLVYLEIVSSEMRDIGVFYSGSITRLLPYSQAYVPFILTPYELLIRDTIFSYVSPFQFDLFDATEWWDLLRVDPYKYETRKITLINNTFEVNDLNVLAPYPGNQSLHFMNDMDDITNFVYDVYNPYFVYNATMLIPNNADFSLINNKFSIHPGNIYVTERMLAEDNVPFIAYNQSENSTISNVCMAGNEFTNFAIWVQNGNITSCVKNDILNYMDHNDCNSYHTFGCIYESALRYNNLQPNVFNIHSNDLDTIIRADYGAYVALENNAFYIYENNTNVFNIMNGNYLFVNNNIEYKYLNDVPSFGILIDDDHCSINCYSQTDEEFVSVLHVSCPRYTDNATLTSIQNIYNAHNYSLSPYFIEIFPSYNNEFAPGETLQLNYSIFDMNSREIKRELITAPIIITYQYESSATNEVLPDFQLIIGENGTCPQCNDGIIFSSITLQDIEETFSFSASVDNNELFVNSSLNIIVANCAIGYGSAAGSGAASVCDACNRGYFNLAPDDNTCYYCDESLVDGITCIGSYNIIIEYDFWVSIYQYSETSDLIFDVNTSEYIVSHKCPSLYCCQLEDGCNIETEYEYLCADNRDFEASLCGKCIDGYSEQFGTNNCGLCLHNYWMRLFIPMVYGLLWALVILVTKSSKTEPVLLRRQSTIDAQTTKCSNCLSKCECCADEATKMKKEEYTDSLEVIMTKIMLYYYQGVAYILSTSGIQHSLYAFVQLFNLNIFMIVSPANANGYCLFSNMNMIQKISIPLTATFFIIFFTISPTLISDCKCVCNICGRLGRKLHFGKSLVTAMLICVGQIFAVLFKLLACRDIGNVSVHYFFGAEECYGSIWKIAFFFLIFVFLIFIALFIWILCRKRREASNSDLMTEKQYAYIPIVSAYKTQYWFWESILFMRRTILAVVFIVFDNDELKFCIAIILLLCAFIQAKMKPFKYKSENDLETCLIVMTVICIFTDIIYSLKRTADVFSDVVLSLLTLLPLIWYLWFMLSHCLALFRSADNDGSIRVQTEIVSDASDDAGDDYKIELNDTEVNPLRGTEVEHMVRVDGTDEIGNGLAHFPSIQLI